LTATTPRHYRGRSSATRTSRRQRAFAAVDQQTRVARDPRSMAGAGGIGPGGRAGATAGRATPAGAAATTGGDGAAGTNPAADTADGAGRDTASEPPDAYDARVVKASYYAMVELIDHEFGRLIDGLEARGELDNTIVIFTSDHGELLGDHGLLLKGCRFFEALVHVPLVVSWPARFAGGRRSRALVELVDLAPTLLEAVGLPVPPEMQGRSLLPLLDGRAEPDVHKPYVFCEYWDAVELPERRRPDQPQPRDDAVRRPVQERGLPRPGPGRDLRPGGRIPASSTTSGTGRRQRRSSHGC
jgi:arylsulfatase A-like enzyme